MLSSWMNQLRGVSRRSSRQLWLATLLLVCFVFLARPVKAQPGYPAAQQPRQNHQQPRYTYRGQTAQPAAQPALMTQQPQYYPQPQYPQQTQYPQQVMPPQTAMMPVSLQQSAMPLMLYTPDYPQQDQGVIPVKAFDEDHEPLPTGIEAMPQVEAEMEVIHHRSQLVVARNPVVRMAISDPSIIDIVQYSPTELSVIGLGLGSTNLTVWFQDNPDPLIYLVTVVRDPSEEEQLRIDYGKLERKIALLFPNSKVYLIPLSRKIIIKGQARDAEEAAQILSIVRGEVINQFGDLGGPQPGTTTAVAFNVGNGMGVGDLGSSFIVNMLEIPGEKQVMLRVRIAELKRSQLRQMGCDIGYLLNNGRNAVSSSMGGSPSTLTGIFENGEISTLINWLAANGTAKVLAEPTLTVLSGHPASFLAGGEFAVPTIVGVGGAQGTSTTFRGHGTSLLVTPLVVDQDLVRMNIIPEFSQIDPSSSVGGVPGLNSRRIQTTVQLREGQTIVLAGLLSRQQSTEVSRVPYLSNIPKIGPTWFSSKRATEDETELLVLVTPEIVRPMDAEEVPPMPGFEVTHPNDCDLYWRGMTEGAPNRGVYQLAPYGRGTGMGIEVGYRVHEPAPASPYYAPWPSGAFNQPSYEGQLADPQMPQGYPMMPQQPMMNQPMMHQPMPHQPMPPSYSMPSKPSGRYEMAPPAMQPQPAMPSQPGTYPAYPSQPMMSPQPGTTPSYPAPRINPAMPAPGLQSNLQQQQTIQQVSNEEEKSRTNFSRLFGGSKQQAQPQPQPQQQPVAPGNYSPQPRQQNPGTQPPAQYQPRYGYR